MAKTSPLDSGAKGGRSPRRKQGGFYDGAGHCFLYPLAGRGEESRPWMGVAIDLEQPLAVDRGVNLRGRKRGMAEQFLDRAQVAAARQKMRGEGMPQRMRRGTIGQAERAAQPLHRQLQDSRAQRSAARADKERAGRRQLERAERDI